jgi:hypothetical protein
LLLPLLLSSALACGEDADGPTASDRALAEPPAQSLPGAKERRIAAHQLTPCEAAVEDGTASTRSLEQTYDFGALTQELRADPDLMEATGLELIDSCQAARLYVAARAACRGDQTMHCFAEP